MEYIFSVLEEIRGGIWHSLVLFFLTLIFSMPLGLLVCFGRMSKCKPLALVTEFIISVLRGTPLMLQLVVVFFGVYYVFGIPVTNEWRFWAAVVGFSINYAAYFAEIYRAGIESIPKGQYEAAKVLGYNKVQTFCKIIFPQMIKRTLPPITNEIITLTKDTSLAFVLAYAEMFTMAKQVAAAQASIAPLFVAGLLYYVFNLAIAFVMGKLEKKLSYYQ